MNILVIGYGSIGRRHTANLRRLGHEVVLLRHARTEPAGDGLAEYYSFDEVMRERPDIAGAIICSPTSEHCSHAQRCIAQGIPFLLEKPPASDLARTRAIGALMRERGFTKGDVAFHLRYHPLLRFIRDFLPQLGTVFSARIMAGYYLPYWRSRDYRQTSSARAALGGGVHLELIHEIDYLLWFLGMPVSAIGTVAKVSALQIDTPDLCAAILTYPRGTVAEVHLDYLAHAYTRTGMLIGSEGTLAWEIDTGCARFCRTGEKTFSPVFSLALGYDINEAYREEIAHFIDLATGRTQPVVSLDEAAERMQVLEAIVLSSKERREIAITEVATGEGA